MKRRFIEAVAEDHVLQFALAAFVADGAIERMIGEQEFEHVLARLVDLSRVGSDDHAFGRDERARGLQLGHFFDFDQAHAAGRLQRQARVIAERRDFDALRLAPLRSQACRADGYRPVVDLERDLFLFRHSQFRSSTALRRSASADLYAHFPWR